MMDGKTAVEIIKGKFPDTGVPVKIPLQKGGQIRIYKVEGGLDVESFSGRSFLPWGIFEETVNLLAWNGGKAGLGDAMQSKLGDSIFRQISSIAAILVWVGICESAPGELILR